MCVCYRSGDLQAQRGECSFEDSLAVHERLVDEWFSADGQGNEGVGGTT